MSEIIVVGGQANDLDVFELDIGDDVGGAMDTVASMLGRLGTLWADAQEEADVAEATYRNWSARFGKSLEERKLPEWKAKQEIESSEDFMTAKRTCARTARNVLLLRTRFAALEKKADLLQSKGAMLRTEFEKTGISTPTAPRARTRVPSLTSTGGMLGPEASEVAQASLDAINEELARTPAGFPRSSRDKWSRPKRTSDDEVGG